MKRKASGMTFNSVELAQRRVEELAMYNRKATRKGRTVFEIFQ